MNAILIDLIQKNIDNPADTGLADSIRSLVRKQSDFSDELFDTLDPDARNRAYSMMVVWCAPRAAEKILERRISAEADPQCAFVAERTLACVRRILNRVVPKEISNRVRLNAGPGRGKVLRSLIQKHLDHPSDLEVLERIKAFQWTDMDFSDELFDHLSAKGRLQIYIMLLVWSGRHCMEKVLERRAKGETSKSFTHAIDIMLLLQPGNR